MVTGIKTAAFRTGLVAAIIAASGAAAAMEGGAPAEPGAALAAAAVAVQAVSPQPDGTARVAECTGVLIEADLVLTAAHCLDEAAGPQHVAVFFFEGAKAVPPVVPVAGFARHPAHRRGWAAIPGDIEQRQNEIASDIAVLRLQTPSKRTPLGFDTAQAPSGLVLAGAGKSGPSGKFGTLRTSALSGIYHTKSGPHLAFGTPAGRVCTGDSGGPAVTPAGVWGISGAIVRAKNGCSTRAVVVPVEPPALAELIRMARSR